jgi:hypothetical protein
VEFCRLSSSRHTSSSAYSSVRGVEERGANPIGKFSNHVAVLLSAGQEERERDMGAYIICSSSSVRSSYMATSQCFRMNVLKFLVCSGDVVTAGCMCGSICRENRCTMTISYSRYGVFTHSLQVVWHPFNIISSPHILRCEN